MKSQRFCEVTQFLSLVLSYFYAGTTSRKLSGKSFNPFYDEMDRGP